MAWAPAIMFTREVLGGDRVLYAMDYPYQYVPAEVTVHDTLPTGPDGLRALFQANSERVFRL
jgi:5-carboxyvanillate decarboxylase